MAHVLVISLGPIQEFIASARRCQDLWFGSYLLSELARAAAKALPGAALVFPDAQTAAAAPNRRAEVANKIVAVIDGDAGAVRAAAESARTAMEARRDAVMRDVFDRVPVEHFRRDTAEAQVKGLMEFLWVAVDAGAGDAGYKAARREAERLLAARKNTRQWQQPPWGMAGVPKSSLDGLRESVLHENLYPAPGARPVVGDAKKRLRYGVEGMERLCGVGLLKRLGRRAGEAPEGEGRRRRFASTSHLAALPWMLSLHAEEARHAPAWGAYCAALDAISEDILAAADVVRDVDATMFGNVDGQVLFEGRLTETLEECGLTTPAPQRAARDALHRFWEAVGRHEPQPYYAILLADGDRMGKVIDHHGRAAHEKLSKVLVDFAASVYGVVRRRQGSLVYSGGDDVLALLPLHTAVACAAELAERFAHDLKEFPDETGAAPTLSAGLAVVHHLTPFDAALEVARRAEKDAKKTRDALTILVDKRGGAEQRVSGTWKELLPALKMLTGLQRLGAVSAKAGHELAGYARLTEGVTGDDRATLGLVARAAATHLFDAKRCRGGDRAIAQAVIDALAAKLPEWHPKRDPEGDTEEAPEPVRTLGERLVVAQQLARAAEEAGEPMPKSLDEVLS